MAQYIIGAGHWPLYYNDAAVNQLLAQAPVYINGISPFVPPPPPARAAALAAVAKRLALASRRRRLQQRRLITPAVAVSVPPWLWINA